MQDTSKFETLQDFLDAGYLPAVHPHDEPLPEDDYDDLPQDWLEQDAAECEEYLKMHGPSNQDDSECPF